MRLPYTEKIFHSKLASVKSSDRIIVEFLVVN